MYHVYKTSVSNVSEERAALVHPRFQSSCGDLVFFTARRKIKEVCQSFPTLLFHLNTIHVLVAAVLTWHARPLPCQTLHLYRLRSALLERWFQTNPPVPVEKQSVFTRFTAGLTDMTVEGNCTFFFFYSHKNTQSSSWCWSSVEMSNLPYLAPTKIHTCHTSALNRCRSRQNLPSPWGSQSNLKSRWMARKFWDLILRLQARCSTVQT